MTKESADEKMTDRELADQSMSGHPKKMPPGVKDTLPQGMKAPEAEGEMHMGGVKKGSAGGGNDSHLGNSSMGAAVKQLNYETERGEHAPDVAGHRDHTHSGGVMKKD